LHPETGCKGIFTQRRGCGAAAHPRVSLDPHFGGIHFGVVVHLRNLPDADACCSHRGVREAPHQARLAPAAGYLSATVDRGPPRYWTSRRSTRSLRSTSTGSRGCPSTSPRRGSASMSSPPGCGYLCAGVLSEMLRDEPIKVERLLGTAWTVTCRREEEPNGQSASSPPPRRSHLKRRHRCTPTR
jgi:hypothetical protein